MFVAGVCSRGKTAIRFVKPGAKINSEYYIQHVLKPLFKNDIRKLFPGELINKVDFHHDSAPAHSSGITQEWLRNSGIKFIPKEHWMDCYNSDNGLINFSTYNDDELGIDDSSSDLPNWDESAIFEQNDRAAEVIHSIARIGEQARSAELLNFCKMSFAMTDRCALGVLALLKLKKDFSQEGQLSFGTIRAIVSRTKFGTAAMDQGIIGLCSKSQQRTMVLG
ncbi:hypothetical protein BV898_08699 [Hypsibius exemplaris]|uniref:Tc1-like transposase DDE domain-containing protein n=1 Tax=Hypsibius exemplaris TaxID=2072580 RepID=A0A1W0WPS0_HYPEX|nr:hypothetical protein BV898_08699 [Hypsibius exemplaris]